MKITIIGPTYPYKGGISHFTTLLVRELRKTNAVQFISWNRQYPSLLYPVEQKDLTSKEVIKEDALFLLNFYNPLSWVRAFNLIRKNNSERLLLTWVSPIQGPIYFTIAFLARKFSKAKIVYICHNVMPHEKKFIDLPLTKLAFSQADIFIVHSKEDKKDLEKIIHHKKIVLGFHPIYSIFNTQKKYNIQKIKKELKLRKKVILFFGYIRPYKGLHYLISAMPKIVSKYKNLSLLVVGEFWSKDKESYIELVKKLKLKDDVVFVSEYVPNEEVGKYFSASDVVVLPYTSATQSGIIPIAYAFAKPVISTAVGGLKDVVEEGKTGLFIKEKNSEDISKKVIRFYSDTHPFQINNITAITKKYSWENYQKLLI